MIRFPKDGRTALEKEMENADAGRGPNGGLRLLQELQAVIRGSSGSQGQVQWKSKR